MQSKNSKLIVLLLGALAFLTNGDIYAAAPLLINIANDLNVTVSKAALSVTAYLLFFGLFTIFFGPLGDRFGKSRIIKICAFGTALFSILGAFAVNLNYLIMIRALNGAFASGILPVTIAFVSESISDKTRRQNTIGQVMGMMFLGGACATIIGGLLTYFGSWRLVYGTYGVAELVLALSMLVILKKSSAKIEKLDFLKMYKKALFNKDLIKIIGILFIMGFCVLGSFTFAGTLIHDNTNYNILLVGVILSSFGIGTIIAGKRSRNIRNKFGDRSLLIAGILGGFSLLSLSYFDSVIISVISLFTFGTSFILLQSTLVTTATELMPQLRGTVMSLASFNMSVSGGIGAFVNGIILYNLGIGPIFAFASVGLVFVGITTTIVMISLNRMRHQRERKRSIQMGEHKMISS